MYSHEYEGWNFISLILIVLLNWGQSGTKKAIKSALAGIRMAALGYWTLGAKRYLDGDKLISHERYDFAKFMHFLTFHTGDNLIRNVYTFQHFIWDM